MRTPAEDDRLARARHARQVIAGSEIRPPSSYRLSSSARAHEHALSPAQRNYLIGVFALLVLGVLLYLVFGFGVASIVFFLMALTLLFGWFVF